MNETNKQTMERIALRSQNVNKLSNDAIIIFKGLIKRMTCDVVCFFIRLCPFLANCLYHIYIDSESQMFVSAFAVSVAGVCSVCSRIHRRLDEIDDLRSCSSAVTS